MADVNRMPGVGVPADPDLRDLFAAKALATLVDIAHDEDWSPGHVAEMAYHYADAMLVARGEAA